MVRKAYIILALAAIVAVAGCKKEVAPAAPAEEGFYEFTLTASAPDADTKTTYDEDKYFSWTAGDKISVLFSDGTTDKFFTLTAQGGGASATFKGNITNGYTLGAADGNKYALYPANDGHSYTSGEAKPVKFVVPAAVDFSTDGFSANIPLAALGDADNVFVFKPMCSVVKFSFHNIPAQTSKVKFKVTAQNTHALSGTFECKVGGYNLYWSPKWAAEGTSSITYTESVSGGKASFYVPIPAWDGTGFIPEIMLTDADSDATLYSAKAKNGLPSDTAGSLGSIIVIPSIKIAGATAWAFPSAYSIDWESVTAAAAGDSEAGFDAIVQMKATADANNLYVYLEVKKDALYDNSAYNYANYSHLYIGSGSATEGESFWGWTAVFESKIDAWMKYGNNARYYHWNGNLTKPTAVEHGGLLYYEIAVTRSAFPGLSGSSAILGMYITKQWVEGETWLGTSDQIGIVPARWQAPLSVTLP